MVTLSSTTAYGMRTVTRGEIGKGARESAFERKNEPGEA